MGLLVRRVMRRAIRALIRVRLLVVVILGVIVVGAVAGLFQPVQLPALSLGLPGTKRAPDATEQFLKGNQTFNASLICGSLSSDTLDRLRSRGGDCQELQQQKLQVARDKGAKLEEINYVGGQPLPDGTSLQFYVVATRAPGARADLDYVTFIFTLDRAGKIAKVQ